MIHVRSISMQIAYPEIVIRLNKSLVSRFFEPKKCFFQILRKSFVAKIITSPQPTLCFCHIVFNRIIPNLSGFLNTSRSLGRSCKICRSRLLIPEICVRQILLYSDSMFKTFPNAEHCIRDPLPRRGQIYLNCSTLIFRNSVPVKLAICNSYDTLVVILDRREL